MTRLIDADKITYTPSVPIVVISRIVNAGREEDAKRLFHVSRAEIEAQPTIDAEPVRHGKWKNDCVGVLRCSECNTQAPWKYGRDFIDYRWESNYCPNCGAKMLNATALSKDALKDIDEEIERAWEYAETD